MEQLPLNLSPEDPKPEDLKIAELEALYKKVVGVNPKIRLLDRETMLNGVKDPEAEIARLGALDAASDKEELRRTYNR